MQRITRHLGQAVFGVAVLATLGFGSAQAFAAPAGGATGADRSCTTENCTAYCIGAGYEGGSCVWGVGGTKKCLCY